MKLNLPGKVVVERHEGGLTVTVVTDDTHETGGALVRSPRPYVPHLPAGVIARVLALREQERRRP